MIILEILKAIVYTAVFSLAITPLDFKLASAVGAIDVPKDNRRMHRKPVPRIGGVSLFLSFVLFTMAFCKDAAPFFSSLLAGAVLIVVIGIIDDCSPVSPYVKLSVQLAAAIFTVSGAAFTAKSTSVVFTIFAVIWVITFTNAHNFIDGLDGLCAGITVNESVLLGILLWLLGLRPLSLASFVLGGACIGFLPYNARNAKIFMGDCGSTFIGFFFGAVSAYVIGTSAQLIIPIAFIFLIPLADIIFAVTRRLANRKNPFSADRSHFHHLLSDRFGHTSASIILRLISAIFGLLGIGIFFAI